jgi:anti-sigma regulatory factor (Ser/Thr protein kinase)
MPGRAYRPSTYAVDVTLSTVGSRRFPPSEVSPRAAREWTREVLTVEFPVDVDSIALVVSELTSNAVVHAKSPFDVTISAGDRAVRVEIDDASSEAPVRTAHGMGLRVTDDVASSWGWHPTAMGKTVWFEMPIGE